MNRFAAAVASVLLTCSTAWGLDPLSSLGGWRSSKALAYAHLEGDNSVTADLKTRALSKRLTLKDIQDCLLALKPESRERSPMAGCRAAALLWLPSQLERAVGGTTSAHPVSEIQSGVAWTAVGKDLENAMVFLCNEWESVFQAHRVLAARRAGALPAGEAWIITRTNTPKPKYVFTLQGLTNGPPLRPYLKASFASRLRPDPDHLDQLGLECLRILSRIALGVDGLCDLVVVYEERQDPRSWEFQVFGADGSVRSVGKELDPILQSVSGQVGGQIRSRRWTELLEPIDSMLMDILTQITADGIDR